MKKYLGKIIAAVIVLGLVIWGIFYWVNNRDNSSGLGSSNKKNSEAQTIIEKDLNIYYPSTPSSVVDLWCRINKCWYGSLSISEKELDGLISQIRLLYDDEFLAVNPLDGYKEALTKEIKDYKTKKKILVLTKVQKQSQIQYFTGKDKDGNPANFASVVCYLMVQEKKTSVTYSYQKFLLREDDNKHWRIVGWEKTDKIDID